MGKRKIISILIGTVVIASMLVTAVSCSSSSSTTTTTTSKTSTTTTTQSTSTTTTTSTSQTTTQPTTTTTTTSGGARAKGWSITLNDIPEVANKTPVNIALLSGAVPEKIVGYIEAVGKKMGVQVNHEFIGTAVMYAKLNTELVGESGAYDVINPESTCTNEWARYLVDFKTLADKYEPGGYQSFLTDVEGHSKAMMRCATDASGNIYGEPFYRYTNTVTYRLDVYNDPTEKAAFKAKYGYELAAPTTWDQVYDQGEFFTRKAGATLKGETLTHDIYGSCLMSGRVEINDETFCILSSLDGYWMRSVRDADGKLTGFTITKEDKAKLLQAINIYHHMMKWNAPGALTASYDYTAEQMANGNVMMLPTQWAELWTWCSQVTDNVPGSELGCAPVPGGRPYFGSFFNAVVKTSKNQEAAYWIARYLGSYECQLDAGIAGWNSCREDVVTQYDRFSAPEFSGGSLMNPKTTKVYIQEWANQYAYMDNVMNWNSIAAGKIYEQQTVLLHDCAAGEMTPEECVAQFEAMQLDFQNRFGNGIKCTEEK